MVKEESERESRNPEDIIWKRYRRYKERGLKLAKIESELEKKKWKIKNSVF